MLPLASSVVYLPTAAQKLTVFVSVKLLVIWYVPALKLRVGALSPDIAPLTFTLPPSSIVSTAPAPYVLMAEPVANAPLTVRSASAPR